jgi:hypothetical protein
LAITCACGRVNGSGGNIPATTLYNVAGVAAREIPERRERIGRAITIAKPL